MSKCPCCGAEITNGKMEYFDSFWEAYPRKVAKPSAMKVWGRIPQSEIPALMEGLKKYKDSGAWSEKKYIPHPATWLNNRRWQDDIDDPPQERGAIRATEAFLEALRTNATLPPLAEEIKRAFYRMGKKWGDLKVLAFNEPNIVKHMFYSAYSGETLLDRKSQASGEKEEQP